MKKYLVLVAMLLAACGEKDADNKALADAQKQNDNVVVLTIDDSGSEVKAKVGQEVEVQLAGNATTGYSWQFVTFVEDENVVEELDAKYVPDENPDGKVGVGGKSIYKLKLLQAGDVIVSANYVRANEEFDEKKDSDFAVKVIIE